MGDLQKYGDPELKLGLQCFHNSNRELLLKLNKCIDSPLIEDNSILAMTMEVKPSHNSGFFLSTHKKDEKQCTGGILESLHSEMTWKFP